VPTDGDDHLPFTWLVPDGPGAIHIYDQTAATTQTITAIRRTLIICTLPLFSNASTLTLDRAF